MTTKEPATGIEFSNALTPPGGSGTALKLLGCGLREKKIAFVNIKIYVVGVYTDASRLAGSLSSWKGKSNLSKDDAFFKALADLPVEKSVRLVLARDIEGPQFWTRALEEPLTLRLKTAGPAGQQALTAFGNIFKNRSMMKQGTAVILTWCQPAILKVAVSAPGSAPNSAAAPDATIDSAVLLAALFDIFLGKDPAAPSLKVSIASNFPSLV